MSPPCLAFYIEERVSIKNSPIFFEKMIQRRTNSPALGSNLLTERLPVESTMEKQRLGEPSWDHMSKAIGKKKKKKKINIFSERRMMFSKQKIISIRF